MPSPSANPGGFKSLLPLLLLTGLVGPALPAQEIPEPPPRQGPGGERPKLVIPSREGEKQAPGGRAGKIGAAEFGDCLARLATFPVHSTRVKRLLEGLLLQPEEHLLALLQRVWQQGSKAQVLGGVRLVEALGTRRAAASLREGAAKGRFPGALPPALEVLAGIDPEGSRPFFFACLAAKEGPIRRQAARFLKGLVRPEDLERLAELTRAAGADTRRRAIGLLARVEAPDRGEVLAACLGDPSRPCRRLAAGVISRLESFPPAVKQRIAAGPAGGKAFPYALLAALDSGRPVLEPTMASQLRAGLESPERLTAALCAAGLVELSYRSDDLSGKPYAEREAVGRLVRLLGEREFYNGRADAFRAARRALRRITGEDFPDGRWARWWEREREVFAGNRARLPLERPELRRRTVVILADPVETFVLRPGDSAWRGPAGSRLVILDGESQARLVARLLAAGLAGGGRPAPGEAVLTLTLRLAGREQVAAGPADDPRLQALAAVVRDEVERNLWQLFGPEDPVKRKKWQEEMEAFFARAGEKEKRDKLKDLVLHDLPRLRGARLVRGLGHLLAIPGIEKMIEEEDLDLLFACIKEGKSLGPGVRSVLEVAALAPGLDAWQRILSYLDVRWEEGGSATLQAFLARAEPERLRRALEHESERIAAAVVRYVGLKGRRRWADKLTPLLASPSPLVRSSALWALGRLEYFQALPRAVRLAGEDRSVEVRRQALFYCGRSGRRDVLPLLQVAMRAAEPRLRLAAVEALGLSRLPAAIDMLTAHMAADPRGVIGRRTAAVLAGWGGPLVRRSVRANLRTSRPELRDATVALLGELLDPAAIPYLVQWLRDPDKRGQFVRTRRLLCAITCVPSGPDAADFYQGWYEANRDRSQAAWFLEALRRGGYSFSFAEKDLLPGAGLGAAGQLAHMLRRLDEWHLRVQAVHRLREITGESFGRPWAVVEPAEAGAAAEAWLGWLKLQREKEKGE